MADAFEGHSYLSLSTRKRDGSWVDTPVWFAPANDHTFYLFSEGKAGKVKRIRNFEDVRICPCTVTGKRLGEWEPARATLLEGDDINTAYRCLRQTYGWQMWLIDIGATLARKKHKRAFIRIDRQPA